MASLTTTKFTKFDEIPEDLLGGLIEIYLEHDRDYNYPLDVVTTDHDDQVRKLKSPPYPDTKVLRYIGHVGDIVVGSGILRLNTGDHNRKNASIGVRVRESQRRKGYGRQLLRRIVDDIPDEVEILFFSIYPKHKDFIDYIERLPVKLGLTDRKSASDLRTFTLEDVRRRTVDLMQEAQSRGFKFIQIMDYMFPDGFDPVSFAQIIEEIWNDMPTEDLSVEKEQLTPEFFNISRKRAEIGDYYIWTVVAIHVPSGKIAGYTDTYLDYNFPDLIHQGDTGLVREFRGNRLGLTLKYIMLERILSDPRLVDSKYIQTHNAGSNSHMIAINDELRYREVAIIPEYEIKKSDMMAALES